jgi:hypothetical protein
VAESDSLTVQYAPCASPFIQVSGRIHLLGRDAPRLMPDACCLLRKGKGCDLTAANTLPPTMLLPSASWPVPVGPPGTLSIHPPAPVPPPPPPGVCRTT